MQINNQVTSTTNPNSERPLQLNEGEVYRAVIKERKENNEASIQIRGKEIHVKFEGPIPKGDKITVEIGQQKGDVITVRSISSEESRQASIVSEQQTTSTVLKNLGVAQPSTELRQAAQILLDKGVPLTRDGVRDLQQFIDKSKFPLTEKLQTIHALANKRLEVSNVHLASIHEALHGRPLHEVLSAIAREMQPNGDLPSVRPAASQTMNLDQLAEQIREQLSGHPEAQKLLQRAAAEANQLQQIAQEKFADNPGKKGQLEQLAVQKLLNVLSNLPSTQEAKQTLATVIQGAQTVLKQEANLEKVFDHIQKNVIVHPQIQQGMADSLEQAMLFAKQLLEKGREMGARQEMVHSLSQLLTETSGMQEAYAMDQTSVQLASKAVAVTTVTQKMAEMAMAFKEIQRDITKNLDVIQRFIEQFRSKASSQVRPMLETTIKKLDHLILKSDMMLMTDMKTEKQLMQASSQLSEAKKLLAKGNFTEANKIVQEVKSQIERVQYQPSETKVKHYTDLKTQLDQSSGKQQIAELSRQIHQPVGEPSARQVFEMVRQLGLNRESEVAQMLTSGREQGQSNDPKQNMKQALLQLLKEEEAGRTVQQANQALNNVTGQQLLSKSDTANMQSMFLSLPLLLQEKTENLKVFINSRNEGEKVDWENCSLYFLIETPRLGEVGIHLTVADRKLAVTIKNDQEDFQKKMEPLVGKYVDVLGDIGYSISGIQYAKISVDTDIRISTKIEQKDAQQPLFTEKGFDYKI